MVLLLLFQFGVTDVLWRKLLWKQMLSHWLNRWCAVGHFGHRKDFIDYSVIAQIII